MKVRTNLKPSELAVIGAGLKKLAAKQVDEIELENPAEKELVRKVEVLFDLAFDNLQSELSKILLDKE